MELKYILIKILPISKFQVYTLRRKKGGNTVKKLFILVLILITCMSVLACSNKNSEKTNANSQNTSEEENKTPVPLKDIENIDITSFFTNKANTMKTFDMVDDKGEKIGEYQEIVVAPHTVDKGRYIIESFMQEFPVESEEKLNIANFYELSNSEFKKVFSRDNLTGEKFFDSIYLTNKQNQWQNKDDPTNFIVTDIKKTAKTPIKTFHDCIEVTEIFQNERTVSTYAPQMGVVAQEIYSDGKLYLKKILRKVRIGVDSPSNDNEPNSSQEIIDSIVEKPDFYITDKTSNLKLMEYINPVNDISLPKLEYFILHRPGYEEKNKNGIYNFVTITPEDLYIICDKDSFIKQITWESKKMLYEEIILNVKILIQGLNNNITIEEVNDYLFSETTTKDFGDFTVEFIKKDEEGFTLNIFAR